jgi:cytochrome c peroxidase
LHQRNSRPLFNLQEQYYFTAADSTLHSVVQQMDNPLTNQHPPELGWYGKENILVQRFKNNAEYTKLFELAFGPQKETITYQNTKQAIAQFVLSITSYNSKWDQYNAGDSAIFNMEEKQGKQLFFSTKTNCSQCHGGKNFNTPQLNEIYFNTGIYNVDGKGAYPLYDEGLKEITKNEKDMGKYKVPTLRNLLFTAPYYHDGSENSLAKIIDYYNEGGRIISNGLHKGDGTNNSNKQHLIKPLYLNATEKKQLLSFLYALTDSSLLSNKNYIY